MKIKNQKIISFVEEVGSKSPTPGGGAVAAVSGALAAALVTMVANLTIGKKGFEKISDMMTEIADKSQNIRNNLLVLADQDVAAYNQVMRAYRISKSNKTRSSKIQKALINATEVPLKTARLAKEILDLSKLVIQHGNKNAFSDARSARHLASASIKSAVENVKINLKFIRDPEFKEKAAAQLVILASS